MAIARNLSSSRASAGRSGNLWKHIVPKVRVIQKWEPKRPLICELLITSFLDSLPGVFWTKKGFRREGAGPGLLVPKKSLGLRKRSSTKWYHLHKVSKIIQIRKHLKTGRKDLELPGWGAAQRGPRYLQTRRRIDQQTCKPRSARSQL